MIVEFTVYNVNLNLFGMVRLYVEFPVSGETISNFDVNVVRSLRFLLPSICFLLKLVRNITAYDFFIWVVVALVIIYFIIEFVFIEGYEVTTYFILVKKLTKYL